MSVIIKSMFQLIDYNYNANRLNKYISSKRQSDSNMYINICNTVENRFCLTLVLNPIYDFGKMLALSVTPLKMIRTDA